ncbi:MAG: MBL fold metallo-hydrolase [Chloroflexi bacterium]|nr:MBL fold metallo-hydrolase [Chloroflexota bacterium]
MADYVWTRQLGRARIAVITEGWGRWPLERGLAGVPEEQWRPEVEADHEDCIRLDLNVVHVALPGASILLDTGFGEVDPTDPARPVVGIRDITMTPGVEAGLATLGVRPADVTHVLFSHLHGDHVFGATRTVDGRRLPAFPRARYYVTAAEWRAAPEQHQRADLVQPQKDALEAAGVVELLDGEREVLPGVRLIPAAGESPGHAVVRVDTGDGIVYYLGDLFHQVAEFRHLDWMPRWRDRDTLVATRQRLLPRFVAERALLVIAHLRFPAVGRVEPAGDAYRWVPVEP